MFGLDRITHDPDILGGKACIRGMRLSVALIVNLVANGMSAQEIIDEYPDLAPEDVRQALRYAAWAAEDTTYTLTFLDVLAQAAETVKSSLIQTSCTVHRASQAQESRFTSSWKNSRAVTV